MNINELKNSFGLSEKEWTTALAHYATVFEDDLKSLELCTVTLAKANDGVGLSALHALVNAIIYRAIEHAPGNKTGLQSVH